MQFSELMAIRHCIFLMGPTGAGRTEVYRVLARALQTGAHPRCLLYACTVRSAPCALSGRAWCNCAHAMPARSFGMRQADMWLTLHLCSHVAGTDEPVNDYLKMVNRQKIMIRDINPKAVSTQARPTCCAPACGCHTT